MKNLIICILIMMALISGCDIEDFQSDMRKTSKDLRQVESAIQDVREAGEEYEEEYCKAYPNAEVCINKELREEGLPTRKPGESLEEYKQRFNYEPGMEEIRKTSQISSS